MERARQNARRLRGRASADRDAQSSGNRISKVCDTVSERIRPHVRHSLQAYRAGRACPCRGRCFDAVGSYPAGWSITGAGSCARTDTVPAWLCLDGEFRGVSPGDGAECSVRVRHRFHLARSHHSATHKLRPGRCEAQTSPQEVGELGAAPEPLDHLVILRLRGVNVGSDGEHRALGYRRTRQDSLLHQCGQRLWKGPDHGLKALRLIIYEPVPCGLYPFGLGPPVRR
jgi:hypothetical protein